jgi:hypothetical protein
MPCQRQLDYIGVINQQGKFLCDACHALNAANRTGDYQLSASLQEEIRVIREHLIFLRDELNQHQAEDISRVQLLS